MSSTSDRPSFRRDRQKGRAIIKAGRPLLSYAASEVLGTAPPDVVSEVRAALDSWRPRDEARISVRPDATIVGFPTELIGPDSLSRTDGTPRRAPAQLRFARFTETTYTGKSAIDNRHDDSRPREPRDVVNSFGAHPRRAVAQLVAHRSPKPTVVGSSPACPARRR